jgi:hypothetical protein
MQMKVRMCGLANTYFVLAVIYIIYCVIRGAQAASLFPKILFTVVWTAFLVLVCNNGQMFKRTGHPLMVAAFLVFLVAAPLVFMTKMGGMMWGMMEGMESKSCAKCKSTHKSCKEACLKASGDTDKCNKKCKDGYLKCYGSSCSS